MPTILLIALLVAAPKRVWSEKNGVGLTVPDGWELIERDTAGNVFVCLGPKLRGARPRAALRHGFETPKLLSEIAEDIAEELHKRAGWKVTGTTRQLVGGAPAVRLNVKLTDRDGNKIKGRATIVRLGGRVFVLEMSALRAAYPVGSFDLVQRSLQGKIHEVTHPAGLKLAIPEGWDAEAAPKRGVLALIGPRVAGARVQIRVKQGPLPVAPPGGKEGPKVRFLARKHATTFHEREMNEVRIRAIGVQSEGYSVMVMMPAAAWDDLFPIAAMILDSAQLPPKKSQKSQK